MDKRKLFISILAGIMALVMLLGLVAGFIPAAHAATSSELKAQLDKLEEDKAAIDAEIEKLNGQITENNDDMKEMVAQKNLIDQEIFLLYQQESNINDQIATYSLLIADKQEQLVAAQSNFEELTERNKARIQAMEEEGSVSYWSVLFEANSFSDLLDRVNMVQEIAAADKRRLKALDEAAKEVTEAKAALEEEKAGLEVIKEELAVTQAQLEEKRVQADKLLADLVAKGMEFEELMDFVKWAKFDRLGAFAYCEEDGTYAAENYRDSISKKKKQERLDRLMEVQQRISTRLNDEKVGKSFRTIIDRIEGDYYVGRTEYDSPDVDTEVLISRNERDLEIGAFYNVLITDSTEFDLMGTVNE